MRTTINIPDDVLTDAKVRAAQKGVSLGSVVEAALRSYLKPTSSLPDLVFPTSGGSGLRPGVRLDDKDQLQEIFDAPA